MAESDDFILQQQRAIERMREMSERSSISHTHKMPPAPPFVRTAVESTSEAPYPNKSAEREQSENIAIQAKEKENSLLSFLYGLKGDAELPLILGLILILWSEKADKKLLLALAYIML